VGADKTLNGGRGPGGAYDASGSREPAGENRGRELEGAHAASGSREPGGGRVTEAGSREPAAAQAASGGRVVEGSVLEERPAAIFAVKLDSQQTVLAHLVGTVKRNFVRLVPGDRVEVELTPHDPTRGRIIRKLVKAS
jgi:translation initiation factor IF-1